uniref:NADH-ubiquinone oxidoreductase chain 4 n=1 Tax=Nuttallia olivacea TaxID=1125678 RepID=I6NJP8_9BIVA|nr:NADH dehydrogenase subunit 4 [Nuttallia olivacea]AEV94292.1 NADH dehydrogenase subunit 4 [Nuttallia olivacea]
MKYLLNMKSLLATYRSVSKFKVEPMGLILLGLSAMMIASVSSYQTYVDSVIMKTSWWMSDSLSVVLISLTIIVTMISLLCSDEDFSLNKSLTTFSLCVCSITFCCIMFFISCNLMVFYFFFESSLIPTTILILGWGHQPERLQAGMQMVLYTVYGSLPMLVLFSFVWLGSGTSNMVMLALLHESFLPKVSIVWFFLFIGMLVKIPVFLVHGWLPKAHVEAPVSGSMVLAGVLLKMGLYGVCRVIWSFGCPPANISFMFMTIALWGGVLCSFMCLCFHDLKSVIAYSSIAHMSMALSGILTMSNVGWMSGICMGVVHGLCSPCMFALANYTYSLTGSRSTMMCKGVLKVAPILSSMWFIFCIINMGCPPTPNFYSECLLFSSISGFSSVLYLPLYFMCFLAAAFSLFIYASVNHGYQGVMVRPSSGLSVRFLISMSVSGLFLISMFLFLDMVFL